MLAKGFSKPVRNYKVVERIDDMVGQGKVIREEQDGLKSSSTCKSWTERARSRLWRTSSRASGNEWKSGPQRRRNTVIVQQIIIAAQRMLRALLPSPLFAKLSESPFHNPVPGKAAWLLVSDRSRNRTP